jgi:hypothetical protein
MLNGSQYRLVELQRARVSCTPRVRSVTVSVLLAVGVLTITDVKPNLHALKGLSAVYKLSHCCNHIVLAYFTVYDITKVVHLQDTHSINRTKFRTRMSYSLLM